LYEELVEALGAFYDRNFDGYVVAERDGVTSVDVPGLPESRYPGCHGSSCKPGSTGLLYDLHVTR
jgi:hypothetical protein